MPSLHISHQSLFAFLTSLTPVSQFLSLSIFIQFRMSNQERSNAKEVVEDPDTDVCSLRVGYEPSLGNFSVVGLN